jgi:hypothetical protein
MPRKTVKLQDLRSATAGSVSAVLGKKFPGKPGVLVGLLIDEAQLAALGSATKIAGDIAMRVSAASGIKVTAGVKKLGGGILVGYIQPKGLKR